ncbi:cell division protein SepF [Clostridia bacterium]|nr:cell division protein SepF [Clostridia bacterium]
MAKFIDGITSALGLEVVDDKETDEMEESVYGDVKVLSKGKPKQKRRVASEPSIPVVDPESPAEDFFRNGRQKIHTMKLFIVEPDNFDQVREAADFLKEKKAIIINLEEVEYEDARKIIDFMSGNIYALGGTVHKISAGIILFAPDTLGVESLKKKQDTADKSAPEIEKITGTKPSGPIEEEGEF